jgi:hypothetical protein
VTFIGTATGAANTAGACMVTTPAGARHTYAWKRIEAAVYLVQISPRI